MLWAKKKYQVDDKLVNWLALRQKSKPPYPKLLKQENSLTKLIIKH